MRIVSLQPAATEIAFELGLGDDVVGVSHDSDWPPEARGRSSVTRPLPHGARRGRDRARPRPGATILAADPLSIPIEVDEAALAELRPDLVLAPALREVVAPGSGNLREAVSALGPDVALVALEPVSLEGILNSISSVAAMTGSEAAGLRLIERLRGRLGVLERRVRQRRDQGRGAVRVVTLEALDPPVAAGRWIPEQVRRAGGWELLGREGEAAELTSWRAVRDVDPETILLMPRGRHLEEAVAAWAGASRPDDWDELEAVRRGQVFAVDAASYFSRPGPRSVDGIALLAEVLDPDGFVETSPIGSWTPVD